MPIRAPSPPERRHPWVVVLFLAAGLLFLGLGLRLTREAAAAQAGPRTHGKVVGFAANSPADATDPGGSRQAIIEFRDPQGKAVRFTNATATATGSPRPRSGATEIRIAARAESIGSEVPVCYPAGQPSKARIDTFSSLWAIPVAISGGGALLVVSGILGALGRWRVTIRSP